MKILHLLFFLICVQGMAGERLIVDCSLIRLLAAPERLVGRKVMVQGFLFAIRGKERLFLTEESAIHNLFENSLPVQNRSAKDLKIFDGKYVRIEATIRSGKENGVIEGEISLDVSEINRMDTVTISP